MAIQSEGVCLSALLKGLVAVAPVQDRTVSGLSLDSRTVRQGELFIALEGQVTHGIEFAPGALARGAAAVLWETTAQHRVDNRLDLDRIAQKVPLIRVPRLSEHLGRLASRFYGNPSQALRVIGITGTDGKTSTSQFVAQALEHLGFSVGVMGTLGYGRLGEFTEASHTTPDAIRVQQWLARFRDQGSKFVVMEASSHGLELGRVNGITFETAVFTNLTRDHLDFHGNMKNYARAKSRLFEMPGLKQAVLNLDDPLGAELFAKIHTRVACIGYTLAEQVPAGVARGLSVARMDFGLDGLEVDINSSWGSATLRCRLLGRFNVSNLLAALGVLLSVGIDFKRAVAALEHVTTVPGRMELIEAPLDRLAPRVVVDYAHTPGALEQVLSALRAHCTGQLWCVFGCGGDRDRGKRSLMGACAEALADRIVITDDNPRSESPAAIVADIISGLQRKEQVKIEHDRARAIRWVIQSATAQDLVLVAGKGHENYQIVGTVKKAFSDHEQVRRCLQELATTAGTQELEQCREQLPKGKV